MNSSSELAWLDLEEVRRKLDTEELSAVELTEAQLDRIARINPTLHAWAHVAKDLALAQASQADAERAGTHGRRLLHGVPLGIKDLLWTKDMPTTAGMAIKRGFMPPEDATAVRRLRDAGAVVLGKVQNTEAACLEHHPTIPVVRNPWRNDLWAGISSSGSGAAVGAGLCHGALGTDTGGSIRWPSAVNSVTGIKPTWGRVSRHGVFALAESMDHVGAIARSARDAALILQAIAGADPADPTSLRAPVPDYLADAEGDLNDVRIGVDRAWNEDDVDGTAVTAVRLAADVLRGLGAEVVEVTVPATRAADWHPARAIEAAITHAATFPSRREEYGPRLASVLDFGRTLRATDYQEILLRRAALRGHFDALFDTIDLLLTPAHPYAPLTQKTVDEMDARPEPMEKLQRYTAVFDMTGAPTISLPGQPSADGLPVGVQLIARHLEEARLVRAGIAFQRESEWHRRRPPL